MQAIIGIGLGPMELVTIFGITLILFGGSKLPQLGKGLGEAIRNFKHGADNKEEGSSAQETEEKASESKTAKKTTD